MMMAWTVSIVFMFATAAFAEAACAPDESIATCRDLNDEVALLQMKSQDRAGEWTAKAEVTTTREKQADRNGEAPGPPPPMSLAALSASQPAIYGPAPIIANPASIMPVARVPTTTNFVRTYSFAGLARDILAVIAQACGWNSAMLAAGSGVSAVGAWSSGLTSVLIGIYDKWYR
eukprot:gnl/TRDRNA2_/TRDRNA2_183073_c0_seq1.p1 gnl/TRDRNA2_/TRDRNA2_183073_c0~~gnl/TRDRNA2_/TRDRNA2_183073_c0_seq1.p1  ORF type:complete len:175 (-),score=19.31 gnl/TRDRNA2_/TRDRNA2_183073_c0_seq1:127-651(-)